MDWKNLSPATKSVHLHPGIINPGQKANEKNENSQEDEKISSFTSDQVQKTVRVRMMRWNKSKKGQRRGRK